MRENWKREQIPDHKFDYIDTDDFKSKSLSLKLKYSYVFFKTVRAILVYMADMGIIVITLISFNELKKILTTNSSPQKCEELNLNPVFCGGSEGSFSRLLPTEARLGIMFASITFSFILLFLDWRKAYRIIKSRDISYAFTSTVAYRYYVIQSYPHFCFFSKIQSSRRTIDVLAFYVFFAFKGWKRLLLAEFPRQFIYALLLIDTYLILEVSKPVQSLISGGDNQVIAVLKTFFSQTDQITLLITYSLMTFTTIVWILDFLSLIVAFFVYIPLLTKIRGNLKEYCCHKIDKRISEILKKKSKKRSEFARKAELRELEKNNRLRINGGNSFSDANTDTSSQYANSVVPPLGFKVAPTLPNMGMDDDLNTPYSYQQQQHRGYQFSNYSGSESGTLDRRMNQQQYLVPALMPTIIQGQYPTIVHPRYVQSHAGDEISVADTQPDTRGYMPSTHPQYQQNSGY